MTGFLRKLLSNHPFANVTFAVVLLVGFLSYTILPRERDPEINFNWVNIATVMPGASAEDIEKRVTKPLEDAIRTVSDIKFVASNSREDVSSILVRFRLPGGKRCRIRLPTGCVASLRLSILARTSASPAYPQVLRRNLCFKEGRSRTSATISHE